VNALLTQQKQTRRSRLPLSQLIPGWVQVALFGWMICWGNHPPLAQSSYDPGIEYVAVGTARIDYSKRSPERSDGRDERERASQFLELVTTINGVRNWHVTGPDLDGRYGGLNGCGGVEAIYNQSTSSATYLLSDTYGHTEGTLSGTTFVWNPTQCDGYGALPGTTKASPLIAGANVASQLGWRGHYIDPTGFYYMGARNYAPDSGTFLSPDPLGHSASMDLYSYCDGDPVNGYDPDGRIGKGAATGVALGGFGQYDNTTQQIAGLVGQIGSYFIPGMQGYSAARDIAFSGYSASKAAYDIGENGLNLRNGSELAMSATGLIPGGRAVGTALRGESSAVFQEVRQTFTLGAETTAARGTTRSFGPGAAHIDDPVFVTSNAARRQAMRDAGIPTSQQPVSQIQTTAGRQYIYDVNGKPYAVTQQTTDRVVGHGPHWEAGVVKPPTDYGLDPLGRARVFNQGKVKVEYGN